LGAKARENGQESILKGQVYVHLYTGGVYSHEMAIATGGGTLTLKHAKKLRKKVPIGGLKPGYPVT